jgi:hypothetical protein
VTEKSSTSRVVCPAVRVRLRVELRLPTPMGRELPDKEVSTRDP